MNKLNCKGKHIVLEPLIYGDHIWLLNFDICSMKFQGRMFHSRNCGMEIAG